MALLVPHISAATAADEMTEDVREVMENRGFEGYSLFFWEYMYECQAVAYQKWLKQFGRDRIPEIISELKKYRFEKAFSTAYDSEIPMRDKADLDALAKTGAQWINYHCGQIINLADSIGGKMSQARA